MRHILAVLILAAGCLCGNAQIFDMLDSDLYRARVKLVSEFMARFNGERNSGKGMTTSSAEQNKINLCQLFDFEQILKNKKENETKAFEFVDSVLDNNIKIHFSDKEWYAKVECVASFKGKETKIDLILTVEPRGDEMYKWVISDVRGSIFDLKPSHVSENIMLLPNEHESDFMKLNSITTEKDDYITLYSPAGSHVDRMSVFNALVYYGFLNIEYVNDIEYTFLQVPGYIFTIREFERESTNSGWLISDFRKISGEDKSNILHNLYKGGIRPRDKNRAKTPKAGPRKKVPAQRAIKMVEDFVESLNGYISDKSYSDSIAKAVKGRYTFIISDELSDMLARHNGSKREKSYRLDTLLGWLSKSDSPVRSISVSDAEVFENENIRSDYADNYTLIKCELTADGKTRLTEKVVFFIYENQIAGVKSVSECF